MGKHEGQGGLMTSNYKINREELLGLAKKIYEEACYGYLDLKESVCDRLVRDFLDGRQIVPPLDTNLVGSGMEVAGVYTGHSGPEYEAAMEAYGASGTYGSGGMTFQMDSGGVHDTITVSVNTPDVVIRSDGPQVRVDEPVRQEGFVRPTLNFEGNESERF